MADEVDSVHTPPGPTRVAPVDGPDAVAATLVSGQHADPKAVPELEQGARIGRFVVLSKLGEGGMGMVYAAHDSELDRKIAIKLLREGLEVGRARLLREARAMARLSHPNVATVHDVGTWEDNVYVAMEFVEGSTLREWLYQHESWQDVVSVFLQAADGLAAAHSSGIVHRDFKPDNVLVGADGRVRVLDFGLAKPAHETTDELRRPGRPLVRVDTNLTQTGIMLGTPAYMAPEQFAGTDIDARTDQFAFCVALYEGLFRQRPFAGKTFADLAQSVLLGRVQPPPASSPVPPAIRALVMRGLAAAREDRFPSMAALRDALLAALQADVPSRRRGGGARLLFAIGLLATLFGGGLWLQKFRATEASPPRSAEESAQEHPKTRKSTATNHASKTKTAVESDGKEPVVSPAPLPSLDECPPPPEIAVDHDAGMKELKLHTTRLRHSGGKAALETKSKLIGAHLQLGDQAAACAVIKQVFRSLGRDDPMREDMRCLDLQYGCTERGQAGRTLAAQAKAAMQEADAAKAAGDDERHASLTTQAVESADEACRVGNPEGCMLAGRVLADGSGVDRRPDLAAERFERACQLGESKGCQP